MSNVYELHGKDQRLNEASDWLASLDRGLSGEEIDALRHWMALDPENQRMLADMAAMWDQMDALTRLTELFPEPLPAQGRAHKRWMAVAATIAVASLVGLILMYQPDGEDLAPQQSIAASQVPQQPAVYETSIGSLSKVHLTDGSLITLNTNSRIEVLFTGSERRILLNRGELHIDVSHDPVRPLNVIVGDHVLQAVGTAFTVKIDEHQRIELLVTDGKVRVGIAPKDMIHGDEFKANVFLESFDNNLSVSKGERIVLDESNDHFETLEPEEVEVQLSWRDGNIIFRGESLGDAAAEISRYTAVEFVFLDKDLQKVRVAGLFKAGDVSGFLASLKANFNIAYERIDSETIQLYASTEDSK